MKETFQVTDLLRAWRDGDPSALDRLTPLVYKDLRRIARHHLMRGGRGSMLQPTDLAHEAYLALAGQSQVNWNDRVHFFAIAARTIRRVLVDQARRRNALKRGGDVLTVTLDERGPHGGAGVAPVNIEILALHRSIKALSEVSPRQGHIVELRYFGGLTIREVAAFLGISPATVKTDWSKAKAWLFLALRDPQVEES